jgi:alkanesulfonate monooxygenase SsuD/methylene tetrahydromethanopterin reductase-like flavin-dependent oxidoreductase (luciferase family)
MDIGLMMDGDYREGQTQWKAFEEVLTTADLAESLGFDSIWLAESLLSTRGSGADLFYRLSPSATGDSHRHAYESAAHWYRCPVVTLGAPRTPGGGSRHA